MKKNSKAKLLSQKIIRETFSSSNKYPGFQARLMAILIDLTLIALLFTPLFMLIGNIFYGDNAPSDMLNKASIEMIEIYETSGTRINFWEFISNSPKYNDFFFKQYGFIKMALYQLIQFIILGVVILIFWLKKQATPGKICLSIKIVDATTLGKPSKRQLIIRLFSYIISILPVFLGVIWMLFDSRKQTWHDKIANTLVVRT